MTPNEMINRINEIQQSIYNGCTIKSVMDEWRLLGLNIRMSGFKLAKHRNYMGRVTWYLKNIEDEKIKRDMRFVCEWVNKDMSPNHKHLKGNCSTRAMAYCLIGQMTYDEIEAEQYRLARIYGTLRNTTSTWQEIMKKRGYVRIDFDKTIRRDRLASMLSMITNPMISRSSGHVAVIHNGKVIDSWDSRGGRVNHILVKKEDESLVSRVLKLDRLYL